MNVTVYLGANFGNDEKYAADIKRLGTMIAKKGHTVIYGGSKEGLMGLLADSAKAAGGKVIGVEPEFFIEMALQHEGIDQLIVVDTMAERKTRMMELGDVFIAFPGGVGTLEEVSEVISMLKLEKTEGKCILYNMDGFYDDLKRQMDRMIAEGFLYENELENVKFFDTIDEIGPFLDALS